MSIVKNSFNGGRALLIGIGQAYPGRLQLPALVRADAEGLASILTNQDLCGYPAENVQLLLDEAATRDRILDGLHTLARSAAPSDTVVIFFSGHGGHWSDGGEAKTYLCPVDYDGNDSEGTGIEADELSSLINAIPAGRVVIILDACHSDGAVHLKTNVEQLKVPFGFRAPALDKLAAGAGRVVISSCRENETSITYSAKGHSLFTYFLLEGLRGNAPGNARNDGLVRVFDVFEYVSLQVPNNPVRGHIQHPVIKMHAEDNFPLALRKGGWFKNADIGTTNTELLNHSVQFQPRLDIRQLERIFVELYPSGPAHDEVWSRAGGEAAALSKPGNGRAEWHAALKLLSLGGGGRNIGFRSLLETALQDFSNNSELCDLLDVTHADKRPD
jgi:hypothetical protein